MDPRIHAAIFGGVVPGVIATLTLVLAGLAIALRRGPLPPRYLELRRTVRPHGLTERLVALLATLIVGSGVVWSMRLVESYDGWWPQNVNLRTPALVGLGAIAAALVVAGPARWWFSLPICLLGAAGISYGVREPLHFTENLVLDMLLDTPAIGLSAFLVQVLIDRICNLDRAMLVRPLPLVALAVVLGAVPAIIFHFGISVSSQQSGLVQAVLVSGALALALLAYSAGHVVLRGVGVLVTLAIGAWMLLGRTLGSPLLTEWSIAMLLLAALGCGIVALILPRLRSWWAPSLLVLVVVGAPLVTATLIQRGAFNETKSEYSDYDYGY
ncbi:MAG: hypothetical protein ACIAS6_06685 [Phycisphaerales bacterium JB060]